MNGPVQDGYAPPKARVDDRAVEPRSWRNALVAYAAGGGPLIGLSLYNRLAWGAPLTLSDTLPLFLVAVPVAALAWRLPRLRWYWVAALAPFATVAVLFAALLVKVIVWGRGA